MYLTFFFLLFLFFLPFLFFLKVGGGRSGRVPGSIKFGKSMSGLSNLIILMCKYKNITQSKNISRQIHNNKSIFNAEL